MSKKLGAIALVIAILALGLSVYVLVDKLQTPAPVVHDIQYEIYLGTNDKDTHQPYGTPEACMAKVDEVLTKHFEGFTLQEAVGGWTNEDGMVDHEYTIVIQLSDTTSEKVHTAANELIQVFNQNTVLIQENETRTEFLSR